VLLCREGCWVAGGAEGDSVLGYLAFAEGYCHCHKGRHCLATSLGATFGDSCLATHGSLASALYTHCSSGIACSCAPPCGSLLSPQALPHLLSSAYHLCLAAFLLARSALPASTFMRFVLLSGYVVYWEACDWYAL
jgi:hypothetical protein